MEKTKPLLFRYKKETRSPSRGNDTEDNEYDYSLDMTIVTRNGIRLPAIDADDPKRTKKADMEKGEDQKDNIMWR